ncbi:MAG: hypothetical protein RPR40_03910 [Bermanella sp.]
MPVEVNYINSDSVVQGNGVEICLNGVVHGHEILKAKKQIVESKAFVGVHYQIIDKSNCTEFNVSAEEILGMTEYDKIIAIINQNFITAIIESRTLKFSLTRLWQNIVRDFNFNNQSFHDRHSALIWIVKEMELRESP